MSAQPPAAPDTSRSLRSAVRPEDRGLARLESAWRRSDALFDLLRPEALLARPIPLRQPFLFYLGHLPAFAWVHLGRRLRGQPALHAGFEELFERGIDPLDLEAVPASPEQWPAAADVRAYRDAARDAVRGAFGAQRERRARERRLLAMVVEHELMHQETLLYMMQALPVALKVRPQGVEYRFERHVPPGGRIRLAGGRVRMGATPGSLPFGWDNEFTRHEVDVNPFHIDVTPVRNAEFLEFVEGGGYARPELWTAEAWAWRQRQGIGHPLSWARQGRAWAQRTLFDALPLERAGEWPVSVSFAEASAYARWRGRRLPTEAELERAAHGTEDGRAHPWGDDEPGAEHGNLDFQHWSPTPAGSHPAGASPEGVLELVGNGWEWTSTVFGPYPGFQPMREYPGYSADFFDGAHYVLRGASWATDRALVRRTFRNWFQPHYPYVFTKFRLVDPA